MWRCVVLCCVLCLESIQMSPDQTDYSTGALSEKCERRLSLSYDPYDLHPTAWPSTVSAKLHSALVTFGLKFPKHTSVAQGRVSNQRGGGGGDPSLETARGAAQKQGATEYYAWHRGALTPRVLRFRLCYPIGGQGNNALPSRPKLAILCRRGQSSYRVLPFREKQRNPFF